MMNDCDWCSNIDLDYRIIRDGKLSLSFVSKPAFRAGHCLVIPKRHICSVDEQTDEEGAEIMAELGRLSKLLDEGYGTGIMQKFQPPQNQNGIKVHHLHFHVFPRHQTEEGLFPTPYPNSFDSFYVPSDDELKDLVERLKYYL
jgi:histidine triad (HIT) family protein